VTSRAESREGNSPSSNQLEFLEFEVRLDRIRLHVIYSGRERGLSRKSQRHARGGCQIGADHVWAQLCRRIVVMLPLLLCMMLLLSTCEEILMRTDVKSQFAAELQVQFEADLKLLIRIDVELPIFSMSYHQDST
jgi:hypothetical protein